MSRRARHRRIDIGARSCHIRPRYARDGERKLLRAVDFAAVFRSRLHVVGATAAEPSIAHGAAALVLSRARKRIDLARNLRECLLHAERECLHLKPK
jgi:hypothetical protein